MKNVDENEVELYYTPAKEEEESTHSYEDRILRLFHDQILSK